MTVRTVVLGAAVLLTAVAVPGAAVTAAGPVTEVQRIPTKWVYRADVDGDGGADRIVLRPGHDLRVKDRIGTGHYRLHVRLTASTVLTRRLAVSFYYAAGAGPWTPWFGSTQIDHVPGLELVLGRTSGAHSTTFTVVTYRHGSLRVLDPPGSGLPGPGWMVNSSYGTGMQGWLCTQRGVRSRSAVPNGAHTRFVLERRSYVLRLVWHLTRSRWAQVPVDAHGQPPPAVLTYASFACPGLPTTA